MPEYSLSTVDHVADVAFDRKILVDHDLGTGVVVAAHHAWWRVFVDPDPIVGWWTIRVDIALADIGNASGFLGAADAHADEILGTLLAGHPLRADLYGRSPSLPVAHPWTDWSASVWYARCPDHHPDLSRRSRTGCGFTGPVTPQPFALDTDGHVDLTRRVGVTCGACGHLFDGRLQAAPALINRPCPSCSSNVAVPLEALHLRCGSCGFAFLSPDVTERDVAKLAAVLSTRDEDASLRQPSLRPWPAG